MLVDSSDPWFARASTDVAESEIRRWCEFRRPPYSTRPNNRNQTPSFAEFGLTLAFGSRQAPNLSLDQGDPATNSHHS